MLWCSGAAAWATATTKQRSKNSSSGVETRNGSSVERPRIGVRNRRLVSDIGNPVDQIPVEQLERGLLGRAGPAVRGQGRFVVDLGAHPHAVTAPPPGDRTELGHQFRPDALQPGR